MNSNLNEADHLFANLPFANLPAVLKEGMDPFPTPLERHIFLYSAITILSGLYFNVSGEYRQQTVHPNLFLFVIGPPATGKSALNYARKLIKKVHRKITDESLAQLHEYKCNQDINQYGEEAVNLTKPLLKLALIPANISSSKLIEHLNANEGSTPSIIAESEIDTLTNANKAEWGNFSDILRKSFHNEPTDLSRRGNDQYFEVSQPQLAVALAGTPNQFRKLITNAEDGLYSRFLVFNFSTQAEWTNVAPCDSCTNLDELFNGLSETIFNQFEFLKDRHIKVQLTSEQWDRLNQFGQDQISVSREGAEANAESLIFRHGLMIFKICMSLTAIRAAQNENLQDTLICDDHDFDLALSLVLLSLENSLQLLPTLPGGDVKRSYASLQSLFEKLPQEFERGTAITIARSLNISTRTADRFLREFVQKSQLLSAGHGSYKKP